MNLRDRSSSYCFLNEAADIVLEQRLAPTPEDREGDIRSDAARRRMAWRSAKLHNQFANEGARHRSAWTCLAGRRSRARFAKQTIREGSLAGSHKPDKTSGGNNSNP